MKRVRYISAFARPMIEADIDEMVEKAQALAALESYTWQGIIDAEVESMRESKP